MTTKQRSTPAHGTEARYKGCATRPACRCPRCVRGAVRLSVLRELDRLQGNPRRVPSGPTWAQILLLRAAGLNDAQIARPAGIHQTAVARIGQNKTVSRDTEAKILAIPLNYRPERGYLPATGAMRRIRALYCLRHSRDLMAQALGLSSDYIAKLARGEFATVRADADIAIRRLYAQLSNRRGTSSRTGNYAARHGWHGPLAWHDIDDPSETPDDDEPDQVLGRLEAKQLLAASRAEDIEFLAKFGIPVEDIAERVGLTVSYVRGQLEGDRKPGWRDQAVSA